MNGTGGALQGTAAFEKAFVQRPESTAATADDVNVTAGWQELMQYIVDAAVCTFVEIALDKWGVCITLILEALDAKCENKTAFRCVIEGVRDDIDHRLRYGRW